jgi:CheY-like chemotaxis protein
LQFEINIDPKLGRSVFTDPKRLQQVIKNLLSNAFKFTEDGGVRLRVWAASGGWTQDNKSLTQSPSVVAFEVADTGIGILPEKQKLIFEAFQQADAGTSRKYGGTGLGLAISRELANLLGGEIQLSSEPGVGSTFTLYLPLKFAELTVNDPIGAASAAPIQLPAARRAELISDDRDTIGAGDRVLLIVEDDVHYAKLIADVAREQDFKVLIATRGLDALTLANDYNPTAISLDVFLPEMLGWTVLSSLKQNTATRHIPVQLVTIDHNRQHGLARGAFSFVAKPTSREGLEAAVARIKQFVEPRRRCLLIVEDNPAEQKAIEELLGHDDIDIVTVGSGAEALMTLGERECDCVVLDLKLPDMTGFDVLDLMRDSERLTDIPVVVFTGRELSAEEEARLRSLARSVVVKGVESPERLLDETSLFLHRTIADLPIEKRALLDRLHGSDEDLIGKTVLLVDDDARNIFALSSVLERRGMTVLTATTGSEAISTLDTSPNVAVVLMDIMMPGMDGYETTRQIRTNVHHQRLPIIALTAKAMKGDREKCLEAGASDYLAKPVDTDQLFSVLRTWVHR